MQLYASYVYILRIEHVVPVHPALQEHRLVVVRHIPFWQLGVQPAVYIHNND